MHVPFWNVSSKRKTLAYNLVLASKRTPPWAGGSRLRNSKPRPDESLPSTSKSATTVFLRHGSAVAELTKTKRTTQVSGIPNHWVLRNWGANYRRVIPVR